VLILTHVEDAVLRLQINRPEKRNALSVAMYDEMATVIGQADQDPQLRVILIHGAPDVFTSGNDLKDFIDNPPQGDNSPVMRFLSAISTVSKPVVAAVSGPAVGIGTTMLLHCDFVYAAENTRFQLPFVNLGLPPEAGASLLMPAQIGYLRAADLLMLGRTFSAATALEYGLITATTADGEAALSAAKTTADVLAAKPPAALRLSKRLMRRTSAEAVGRQIREEAAAFAEQLHSPEAGEAIAAFFEKRPPKFTQA
jgi:enoyl-CoA hydratase/carnithine racemase